MFSVQKVKNEIQSLYRYGMDAVGYSKADVESMLKTIDFAALTQALRHNSETVYSIFIDGDLPDMLRHRGRELFGERAARIYVDNVLPDAERLEKRVTDGNLVAGTRAAGHVGLYDARPFLRFRLDFDHAP